MVVILNKCSIIRKKHFVSVTIVTNHSFSVVFRERCLCHSAISGHVFAGVSRGWTGVLSPVQDNCWLSSLPVSLEFCHLIFCLWGDFLSAWYNANLARYQNVGYSNSTSLFASIGGSYTSGLFTSIGGSYASGAFWGDLSKASLRSFLYLPALTGPQRNEFKQ